MTCHPPVTATAHPGSDVVARARSEQGGQGTLALLATSRIMTITIPGRRQNHMAGVDEGQESILMTTWIRAKMTGPAARDVAAIAVATSLTTPLTGERGRGECRMCHLPARERMTSNHDGASTIAPSRSSIYLPPSHPQVDSCTAPSTMKKSRWVSTSPLALSVLSSTSAGMEGRSTLRSACITSRGFLLVVSWWARSVYLPCDVAPFCRTMIGLDQFSVH